MEKNLPIKYRSESAVKRALHIESFRNLSKDKIMKFVSMIPYMDKEVALTIINQFPEFVGFGKSLIDFYANVFNTILEKNRELDIATIQAYQTILDSLSKRLSNENITETDRQAITADMISIADKIAAVNLQSKKFYHDNFNNFLLFGAGVFAGIAAAIGISSQLGSNNELPEIENDESHEE